jgi:hypothetical protein
MDGDIVLVPVQLSGCIPGIPKIGPKDTRHPTVGGTCLLCQEAFVGGDYTSILPMGPGGDQESRTLCKAGQTYQGIGIEVHWTCATGQQPVEIIKPTDL